MSIDLNDKQFEANQVFNNGKAGRTENVTISVEKKTDDDHERAPDYKVIATDEGGATVNEGFYYFQPKDGDNEKEVKRKSKAEISRYVSLARAVMGEDAKLPEVSTPQEALDAIMKLVKENAGSQKFNVFTNYGTEGYASKYLRLRRYNFIEPASTPEEESSLKPGARDIMTPVQPDAAATTTAEASSGW